MVKKGKPRNNKLKKAAAVAAGIRLPTSTKPKYVRAGQQIAKYAAGDEQLLILNPRHPLMDTYHKYGEGFCIKVLYRHPNNPAEQTPTWVQILLREDHLLPDGQTSLPAAIPLDPRQEALLVAPGSIARMYTLEKVVITEAQQWMMALMEADSWYDSHNNYIGDTLEGFWMQEFGIKDQHWRREAFREQRRLGNLNICWEIAYEMAEEIVKADGAALGPFANPQLRERKLLRKDDDSPTELREVQVYVICDYRDEDIIAQMQEEETVLALGTLAGIAELVIAGDRHRLEAEVSDAQAPPDSVQDIATANKATGAENFTVNGGDLHKEGHHSDKEE